MAQRDLKPLTSSLIGQLLLTRTRLPRGMKSAMAIAWKGDVGFAANQLVSVPPGFDPDGLVTAARVWVLTLQRKFAEALQVLQQFGGETLIYPERGPCPKSFLEGFLYLRLGDKEKRRRLSSRPEL